MNRIRSNWCQQKYHYYLDINVKWRVHLPVWHHYQERTWCSRRASVCGVAYAPPYTLCLGKSRRLKPGFIYGKATKQPDLPTSSASRSNTVTSDPLRSSGCLTCSMNAWAPTASISYGGNRELSPYSSTAKIQQAQKATHVYLCYATIILYTNSLKGSYSIVLPPLWMSTSSLSRQVSGQESPAIVNS